jgi:hypothetical protein
MQGAALGLIFRQYQFRAGRQEMGLVHIATTAAVVYQPGFSAGRQTRPPAPAGKSRVRVAFPTRNVRRSSVARSRGWSGADGKPGARQLAVKFACIPAALWAGSSRMQDYSLKTSGEFSLYAPQDQR